MDGLKKFALAVALMAVALVGLAYGADSQSRLFSRDQLQVSSSTATVNSATADYSTWQPILTVTPDGQHALDKVQVSFDLAKASTGFAAVYTSGTISFSVQRKTDGTNWRTDNTTITTAISGTNAAAMCIGLAPGVVGPSESVRIAIKISSVSNTNVVIPYSVYYTAGVRATITPAS